LATHEIFMPALSSTMTEGKIVEWLKKPGDKVERGESVLVVESDKADMDVESFNEGYLAAVLMPAGGTAPVGETIGLIVETEAEIAEAQAKAPAAPAAAAAPAPAATPAPATA
jgi:pyruvate dehydrogenase E2 component (dihydrolipoamide acetyltransferase)